MKRFAFTLAEILIVLVIIGVLTMILLPMAFQSSPDEAVMKFKKGHNIFLTTIKELVSSDKYYQNGDLGIKPNGEAVEDKTYMCETMADVLNINNAHCSEYDNYTYSHVSDGWVGQEIDGNVYEEKTFLDDACKESASSVGEELVTADKIVYYQASPGITFGIDYHNTTPHSGEKAEAACGISALYRLTSNCEDLFKLRIYKIFCMDIDGIDKGENPFGYGVRIDGKILTGKRTDEWLQKSIQKK